MAKVALTSEPENRPIIGRVARSAAQTPTTTRNWHRCFAESYDALPSRNARAHRGLAARVFTGKDALNDDFHGSRRAAASEISGDSAPLVLVDEADCEVGFLRKALCHDGQGILHRAFSRLIFNGKGELLLQQRAATKRLWPRSWSNSCCGHPRRGETTEEAITRRLFDELGLNCPLQFLFKFQYQAQFGASRAEHELCSDCIARCSQDVRINSDEILGWRWIAPETLAAEISAGGAQKFTPWLMLE